MPAEHPALTPHPLSSDDGGALILAAGYSRRFGADKRRHPLENGTPMLLATLARYRPVFRRLAVVLRADDNELHTEVSATCPTAQIITTDNAHLGMGYSLASGIGAADGWAYACIGLGDMPYVLSESLARLLKEYLEIHRKQPTSIVQPTVAGRRGHPIIFGACYFDEMKAIRTDEGARSILDRYPDQLRTVALDDSGLIEDLDRPR